MVTKRDVKKPEDNLIPAYPQCGTCPYALIHGVREDGSEILKCHGHGAQIFTIFTPLGGFELRVDYPETRADRIGCPMHPLWPAELRKPYIDASKRPRPGRTRP